MGVLMEITKQVSINNSTLPSISVCMIVRDEEDNLNRLLPILYKSVDEIIIVDTGSVDNTMEVAKKYTDNVYSFEWVDDFSKARNESLKYATKDYILWLDADDMIARQDIAKLRFHLMKYPNTAVFVNLIDKRNNIEHVAKQLRVFPNVGIEFRRRVHEQASFSVEEKGIQYSYLDINILHLGYSSKDFLVSKSVRNLKLLFFELGENEKDYFTNLNIAKTYLSLGKIEDARMFIKKCIGIVEEDKVDNREHAFLCFYTYFSICYKEGKLKEVFDLFEKNRPRFFDIPLYKLIRGELLFRFKKYEEAYMELSILSKGVPLGVIPINKNLIRMLNNLYMLSSLHIGDLDSAESCIRRFIHDPEFTIKRRTL
jgi:glycosyltransferase involved in cell wall biosynthesis